MLKICCVCAFFFLSLLVQSNICDTKFCGSVEFMQLLVIPGTRERKKKRKSKRARGIHSAECECEWNGE